MADIVKKALISEIDLTPISHRPSRDEIIARLRKVVTDGG